MARITNIFYEKDKGFWIDESDFEIICAYIVKAFEEKGLKNQEEWYIELYEDFEDIMKGHKQKTMFITFELLDNLQEREEKIISVLESYKTLISKEGEKLSAEKMNKMQAVKDWGEYTKVEWVGPLYTADMLQTIDIMIAMLKHEWTDGKFMMKFR